ncbi:MAG TPA: GEVED domain-containing protein [Ferruginibacter sp.]|nr:GEVED domain-containing protein [Ferruginibacter sp.]
MQSNTTLKRVGRFLRKGLLTLGAYCLFSGSLSAQQYINGNLSTGANSSNGQAAPAGFTWSEVQLGNVNAGFGASVAANLTLADDFTVTGSPWTLSKITFFAYSTGYAGSTSPFDVVRVQIFNTDPSVGTPTPIFGDLTTNRFLSSSTANMYRIFNAAPGTTRQIWKIEAAVNTVLAPGTYWIEFQVGTSLASNFVPPSTVTGTVTQPGANSKQHDLTGGTWANVLDGTNPQDQHFIIDYATSACTGTPDPGNTLSTLATVCPGVPFTVSFSNTISGTGITYQWQSSPDNVTWTDITGATNTSYTGNQTAATYYRCAVTCSGGGTGFSTPLQVLATPPSGCYCSSGATSTADEDIFNVTVGTLNNSSTCATTAPGFGSIQNRYSNYTSGTGAPAPGRIVSGGNNPFSVTIGTCGGNWTNSFAIFVDYNSNGQFEAAEKVYSSPSAVGPHTRTGEFFIPATATQGTTLMRVVSVETGNSANITACGTYTWGETEDYLVDIVPCTPVTIGTQPTSQTTTCGGSATFTTSLNGDSPSYQWQQRAVGQNFWTDLVNNSQFSGVTTNTLTITGATTNLNGYQYRVNFRGACSASDFTNAGTLTVSPLQAQVTPTSATICNGTSQQLTINNSASASTTLNFTSGNLGVIVPDDDEFGITRTIAVSGIPANAVITNVDIRFNINHTWVGDLDINVIAPNNVNMNLVGALNGGTGGNGTDNFTNTVISSTGVDLISGAAAPRTGTYAAERRNGYGPTNNTQTSATTNWSDLFTTMNGDWKIAIADFAAGDEGTLVNWDISITYTSPTLATGIWSPTTGLFEDAALTIPYTGNALNTVYAAPTTSTTYNVIVSTQICTTPPFAIPVTVANAIANVTDPQNASTCANGNVSFSVSADGNPIEYQWQVSTDGVNFVDVVDDNVYSGSNSNTLSLTNVPASFNGYRYRCILSVAACNSVANTGNATLTVNPNPTIALTAAPHTSLFPGLRTVLTASVSPNAGAGYVWALNGSVLQGVNGGTYEVNIDGLGDYQVGVVDINGCIGVSNVLTIRDSLNTSLFIYPNPNSGLFQVRYHDRSKGVASPRFMNIYDSKGARVYSRQFAVNNPFGRMDVDLRNMPKGVYVIDLVDAGGVRMETGKVIIF